MPSFAEAVAEGGGAARLRALLDAELARGEGELGQPRSGYGEPVTVAFSAQAAALPLPKALRADAGAVGERARLVAG